MKYLQKGENAVADALSRNPREEETNLMRVIEWASRDDSNLLQETIQQASAEDEFYQKALTYEILQLQLGVTAARGILLTAQNQIYVPAHGVLCFQLILEIHNQPFAGHWNERKTY